MSKKLETGAPVTKNELIKKIVKLDPEKFS